MTQLDWGIIAVYMLAVAGIGGLTGIICVARFREFALPRVLATMAEYVALPEAVFDVAMHPRGTKPCSPSCQLATVQRSGLI